MFDLTGRVALVTGAGQGMGAGITRALADQGARVIVNGRTQAAVDAVVERLGSTGADVQGFAGDLTAGEFPLPRHTELVRYGLLGQL